MRFSWTVSLTACWSLRMLRKTSRDGDCQMPHWRTTLQLSTTSHLGVLCFLVGLLIFYFVGTIIRLALSLPAAMNNEPTESLDWKTKNELDSWKRDDQKYPIHPAYNWDITLPEPIKSSDWINLLNKHSRLQQEICSSRRPLSAVVFYCQRPCLGIADGIRGFLVAYALAVITNRAFLINSPNHFPVESYLDLAKNVSLLPGEIGTVNWHVESCLPAAKGVFFAENMEQDLQVESPIPGVISKIVNAGQTVDTDCQILQQLAVSEHLPDILLLNTNHHSECALSFINDYNKRHSLEEISPSRHEPIFRTLFRRLFSFSQDTLRTVDKDIKTNHVDLNTCVCVHVNTCTASTDTAGSFTVRRDIGELVQCASAVQELLRPNLDYSKPIHWLVVSNNASTSQMIFELSEEAAPNGKQIIIDIDRSTMGPARHLMETYSPETETDNHQEGITKCVLSDLYLLSSCKYLVTGAGSDVAGLGALLGGDWSHKKVFRVDTDLRVDMSLASYARRNSCRRVLPTSPQ
eukprot:scpid53506/ scgid34009/ 